MSHHHPPSSYNHAFAIATLLNMLFVVVEAFYAINANSASLLADAGHNLGDVFGLGFAWFAQWLSQQESGRDFSYGHKRATIVAALCNALLILLTAIFIAYEGVSKLLTPEPVAEVTVVVVALIGVLLNGGTALLFLHGRKDDLNIEGAFLHLIYDALVSIAVVVAGVLIYLTGYDIIDALLSLLIVVMIVAGTWSLLKDSTRLMLDAVPKHIDISDINRYLENIVGVKDVHELHVWALSTREFALTAHLVVPDVEFTDEQHAKINHDLWQKFRINHITIQVERGQFMEHCDLKNTC